MGASRISLKATLRSQIRGPTLCNCRIRTTFHSTVTRPATSAFSSFSASPITLFVTSISRYGCINYHAPIYVLKRNVVGRHHNKTAGDTVEVIAVSCMGPY